MSEIHRAFAKLYHERGEVVAASVRRARLQGGIVIVESGHLFHTGHNDEAAKLAYTTIRHEQAVAAANLHPMPERLHRDTVDGMFEVVTAFFPTPNN